MGLDTRRKRRTRRAWRRQTRVGGLKRTRDNNEERLAKKQLTKEEQLKIDYEIPRPPDDPNAPAEMLSEKFAYDIRYDMWQFMNLAVAKKILESQGCNIGVSRLPGIKSRTTKQRCRGTVCYKGTLECGHYVFVSKTGKVYGTYESEYIKADDDGMCHGAALVAALHSCGAELVKDLTPLIPNPTSELEYIQNYRTMFQFYQRLLGTAKNSLWLTILRELHTEGYGTSETHQIPSRGVKDNNFEKGAIRARERIPIFLERLANYEEELNGAA